MKYFILTFFLLNSIEAFCIEKIMDCEANAQDENGVVFEIKAEIFNSRVALQGATIKSDESGVMKVTNLSLVSNDEFRDNFSIFIKHKEDGKIIESETMKDLHLNGGTRVYEINKVHQNYEMHLKCIKI
jgi:hypothetical protein